jgi:polyhydroxyalkanoate synthase subunit PhaC
MFALMDTLRRARGDALGALGFGPTECGYHLVTSAARWRLRDYGGSNGRPSLLIVAAPIKRPYIWDFAPSVSAVRYCLDHRLRVYLLEWRPPSAEHGDCGLDEYVDVISQCVATISRQTSGAKPFLLGHSLGGTIAAIFAASEPQKVRGLVLLGAPLCFPPGTSRFRDALVSMAPPKAMPPHVGVVPGSLLSQLSALASPETFIWSRLLDAAFSITDAAAMDIHARIERWALDEVPIPGRLAHHIFRWLYSEDRLYRGTLRVHGQIIGPSDFRIPLLAVANAVDEVAPMASVKLFLESIPSRDVRFIRYPGEIGVGLQHLGILIGRRAYASVWPEIISWLDQRYASDRHTRNGGNG